MWRWSECILHVGLTWFFEGRWVDSGREKAPACSCPYFSVCDYITVHGKGDYPDMITLNILSWRIILSYLGGDLIRGRTKIRIREESWWQKQWPQTDWDLKVLYCWFWKGRKRPQAKECTCPLNSGKLRKWILSLLPRPSRRNGALPTNCL